VRTSITLTAFVLALSAAGLTRQTRPAATSDTKTYEARCAACHGTAMTGASGPSILAYVRYHTDADLTSRLREAHVKPALDLSEADLRNLLADVRILAGTDRTMATGGFTGVGRLRGGAGAPTATGRGERGSAGAATTIALADGRRVTGTLVAQSAVDAVLFADGRYVLLARDGDAYREKPIAPKRDWTIYHGSPTGNRYSTLEGINVGNVGRLAPAWMFGLPSPMLETTPVVMDGIMYVTGWNELFALDATTGRQLWSYGEARTEGIKGFAGAGVNRGAAIAGDRVFMATDHAHLLAFDRFTGERLWDTAMADYRLQNSTTVAPLIADDLVIEGTAGGEDGARGFVAAHEATTGREVWRFYPVPRRGEPGSDTWKGQAIDHGGGSTWQAGSYDPQLDLVYWPTGNPSPDYNGEERLGDNLYTASVVALERKTGKLRWYYQFSPHDTHDWDAAEPMLLVDEMWQGRPRKLLMHGDRNGMFYVLDRVTGEFLLGTKLATKVTWNKGFTPDGKPIIDPASIATPHGVAVCPGSSGGPNWQDASYSPITRLFYVRVLDSCGVYASGPDPIWSGRWWGGGSPSDEAVDALAALQRDYATGTYLRAIDPFTGRKVWDVPSGAGVLSTDGGLIFMGGGGGLLVIDAKTGKVLRSINIGKGTNASPMTYMVGGRQYVALASDGAIVAYAVVE
jgi:alcohol dehydrogenase (cytochrome c)